MFKDSLCIVAGLHFQLQALGSPPLSPNNATSSFQQPQQHNRSMSSSVASAKEDEVTSSEEAKAFTENDKNSDAKGKFP